MLRGSAVQTDTRIDLRGVAHLDVDPLLAAGAELRAFVDAALSGVGDLDATRTALEAVVGADGAVRAAAVAGNFQMMNRLVDGAGVRVPRAMTEIADDLGIDRPVGRVD